MWSGGGDAGGDGGDGGWWCGWAGGQQLGPGGWGQVGPALVQAAGQGGGVGQHGAHVQGALGAQVGGHGPGGGVQDLGHGALLGADRGVHPGPAQRDAPVGQQGRSSRAHVDLVGLVQGHQRPHRLTRPHPRLLLRETMVILERVDEVLLEGLALLGDGGGHRGPAPGAVQGPALLVVGHAQRGQGPQLAVQLTGVLHHRPLRARTPARVVGHHHRPTRSRPVDPQTRGHRVPRQHPPTRPHHRPGTKPIRRHQPTRTRTSTTSAGDSTAAGTRTGTARSSPTTT